MSFPTGLLSCLHRAAHRIAVPAYSGKKIDPIKKEISENVASQATQIEPEYAIMGSGTIGKEKATTNANGQPLPYNQTDYKAFKERVQSGKANLALITSGKNNLLLARSNLR